MNVNLRATSCAICGTEGNAHELYPENFDDAAFNAEVFSARRLPDMLHYRLVRCERCGLVRSDPVIDQETLKSLYSESELTYARDFPALRRTYGSYLRKLQKYQNQKGSILEIGCGNGFLLEEALSMGYQNILGVEPSRSAVEQASPELKEHIHVDVMRPGLVSEKMDVICMFQLFDHIPNPNEFLAVCCETMAPEGLILCFNHNIDALSARLLGERSPIIDIEHTYLYNPATIKRLFEKNGFKVLEAGMAWNYTNPVSLGRLLPFPKRIKMGLVKFLENMPGVGRLSMPLPLGNLYLIAKKV